MRSRRPRLAENAALLAPGNDARGTLCSMRIRLALAALVASSVVACEAAPPAPPVAKSTSAIISGTEDNADPAVVAVVQRRVYCAPAVPQVLCSGTLVSPRHVLTAAHCTKASSHPGFFEIYFGSRAGVDPAARYVRVSAIAVHPLWDDAKREHDAALFQLAEDVAIPPAALPTRAMDATDIGSTLRAVGFGLVSITQGVPDGAKREGTMKVDQVNPFNFRATPGPALTCAGDSGGPVFMNVGGSEKLVGITVSGDPPCSVYATNTRVDTVMADFITPMLAADAGAPAPPPTIAPDKICSQSCADAGDCPGQLACGPVPGDMKNRCELPAILAGDFGAVCTTDSECGGAGPCARLAPSGADACRCFRACGGVLPPIDAGSDAAVEPAAPAADSGCSVSAASSRASDLGTIALAFAIAAIAIARLVRRAVRLFVL